MTKKAMVDLYKEGIVAHIQIHDELDLSVESEEHANKIIEIMENAVTLEVPNKVDYESGENWGDIYGYNIYKKKLWHTLTQIFHRFIAKLGQNISMIWTCLRNEVKRLCYFRYCKHLRSRALISYLVTEWCGLLSFAYLSVFPKTFI
jgi:hypothetical protein